MADVVHDPNTGQNYVRVGSQWREVTPDQARIAEESGVEAFAKSAATQLGRTITGGLGLAGHEGAQQWYDTMSRDQQTRGEYAPFSTATGSLVPDIAIGAATAGSGVGLGAAARLGLTEAAIGGFSEQSAQQALVQGGIGAAAPFLGPAAGALSKGARRGVEAVAPVIGANRLINRAGSTARKMVASAPVIGPMVDDFVEMGQETAIRTRARNLNAAATTADDAGRYRKGLMSVDEIEEYAGPINLHDGVQAKLMAATRGQHKEASDFVKGLENWERGQGGGDLTDSLNALSMQATETFNKRIGLDPEIHPDKAVLGDHLRHLSAQMNENRAAVKGNLDMDGFMEEIRLDMDDALYMTDEAERVLKKLEKKIDVYTEEGGAMSAESAGVIENSINRAIDSAVKASDTNVVDILSEVKERLGARLQEKMTPEQRAFDLEKRTQWMLTKQAVMSPTAVGTSGIKPRSMYTALTRGNHLAKTGRSNDPFIRYLDTVKNVLDDREPLTGARLQMDLADVLKEFRAR